MCVLQGPWCKPWLAARGPAGCLEGPEVGVGALGTGHVGGGVPAGADGLQSPRQVAAAAGYTLGAPRPQGGSAGGHRLEGGPSRSSLTSGAARRMPMTTSPWMWSWLAGRAGVSGQSWCVVRTWPRSAPGRWRWATRTPSTPRMRPPALCTTGGRCPAPRGQGSGRLGAPASVLLDARPQLSGTLAPPRGPRTPGGLWPLPPGGCAGLAHISPPQVPGLCPGGAEAQRQGRGDGGLTQRGHRALHTAQVGPAPRPTLCPGLCWKREAGGVSGDICGPRTPWSSWASHCSSRKAACSSFGF